ncbi:MAG: hypothetical protein UT05_C0007G0021 [Parcubacteria group bacterium GW2011_GWF2_38_76]|nr:MAG: hypothetical protein UT05_C0007G0021 [Parcubacteria group bacterium GW2011_GWF2_38_76]HBM46103.1 hypothetical protein [Patescibacteria group bacterium]
MKNKYQLEMDNSLKKIVSSACSDYYRESMGRRISLGKQRKKAERCKPSTSAKTLQILSTSKQKRHVKR